MTNLNRILWTGGWDSTFQLVRSLIVNKSRTQPYYVIDEDRPSMGIELQTMRKIKKKLVEEFPEVRELLLPTEIFALSDIPKNAAITDHYRRILKTSFIGAQYDWLARLCHEYDITGLQLCIHEDDKAHGVIADLVEKKDAEAGVFRLNIKHAHTDAYELFKYYEFPVLTMTKRDMENIARDLNFIALMELTWFCHRPRRGKPCGKCNPCLYTIEEGMGWRIPYSRRIIGKMMQKLRLPDAFLRGK